MKPRERLSWCLVVALVMAAGLAWSLYLSERGARQRDADGWAARRAVLEKTASATRWDATRRQRDGNARD